MIQNRLLAGLAPVALAIAIRLWLAGVLWASPLRVPHEGGHDRTLYHEAALAVAEGQIFPETAFEHMPLYPWVLGSGYALLGADLRVAAGLGIATDVLTVLLLVLLALRLGAKPLLAGLAGTLYAAYPLAVAYAPLTMPNTLNTCLLTAVAYALVSLRERKSGAWAWAGAGLLCGIAALGFAGLLVIAPLFLLWQGIRGARTGTTPWPGMGLFALGLVLPLLPVAVHNTRAEGSFVLLTTHGGFNFYMGNHEQASGHPVRVRDFRMSARPMLEDAHRAAELETGRRLTRAEASAWWAAQGRAFWREHPVRAIALTLKKTALFWNIRDVDDLRIVEQLRLTDDVFRSRGWPGFGWFGFLGLIGLIALRGGGAAKLVLLGGMGSLVLYFITARYRLTLVPVMGALGAAGFANLPSLWQRRDPRLLALIPAVALLFLPFPMRDLRPFDYYNASVQSRGAGKPELALRLAQEGVALDPNLADLHHAEGSALAALGRHAEAADAFARTVQLQPAHPTGAFNLALCLMHLERLDDALLVLERRLALAPQDRRASALYRDLQALRQ